MEEFIFTESGWIEDKYGNIICQFWDKNEEDFLYAKENGKRIADLLNSYGLKPTERGRQP